MYYKCYIIAVRLQFHLSDLLIIQYISCLKQTHFTSF